MEKQMMTNSAFLALVKFGFKQTTKGAVIVALLVAFMVGLQGTAYVASYPDQKSRDGFAATLQSVPALGMLYGDAKDINTPAGYMVYRAVPFMTLVATIWGLMATTKLLRGQEEDGKMELIVSSRATSRNATLALTLGLFFSLVLAALISTALMWLVGSLPNVGFTLSNAVLSACAIFVPTILFVTIGVFVSQLSITRRRALIYGFFLLLLLYVMRAVGNTVSDWQWLKQFTPFGWSDLLRPASDMQPVWILPSLIASIIVLSVSIFLSGKRDLGQGLLPESRTTKSRYILLGSYRQFIVRQNIPFFISWGAIALFVSSLIAALSGIATKSLQESETLSKAIGTLGGTSDARIAFIGTGIVFTSLILLIMTTVGVSSIRNQESRNYLDTILVQPIRRTSWLAFHGLFIVGSVAVVSFLAALLTWWIAKSNGISLDLANVIAVNVSLTGIATFLLGFGTLLYGVFPKIAAMGMYIVLLWSFIIDILRSVLDLNDTLVKSSLFHYISTSPIDTPDWKTVSWLIALGLIMAAGGILIFTKRDTVSE
jgi:ABC-2 type transport system permease protein